MLMTTAADVATEMRKAQVVPGVRPPVLHHHDVVNRPGHRVWPVQRRVDAVGADPAGPPILTAKLLHPCALVHAPSGAPGRLARPPAVLPRPVARIVESLAAGGAGAILGDGVTGASPGSVPRNVRVSVARPSVVVGAAHAASIRYSLAAIHNADARWGGRVERRITKSARPLVVGAAHAFGFREFLAALDGARNIDLDGARLRAAPFAGARFPQLVLLGVRGLVHLVVVVPAKTLGDGLARAIGFRAFRCETHFPGRQRRAMSLKPAVVHLAPRAFPRRPVAAVDTASRHGENITRQRPTVDHRRAGDMP